MSKQEQRKSLAKAQVFVSHKVDPSSRMWIDKIKRDALPRTLTSILMGDPPPGYSALDKRRHG